MLLLLYCVVRVAVVVTLGVVIAGGLARCPTSESDVAAAVASYAAATAHGSTANGMMAAAASIRCVPTVQLCYVTIKGLKDCMLLPTYYSGQQPHRLNRLSSTIMTVLQWHTVLHSSCATEAVCSAH